MKKFVLIPLLLLLSFSVISAQKKPKYNYAAQKKLLPAELGRVYLGMPLAELSKRLDLSNAEVGDTRFDWLELSVPFEKGDLTNLTVRIYGLSQDDKKAILHKETIKKKDDLGEDYEIEVDRLDVGKIPGKGFVYAMYIAFKKDFDLKSRVVKTYGQPKPEDIYKEGDEYHIYDMQWTKKTSDGLVWLIRAFYGDEGGSLQLLGRIDGTEWGLDG
ncbi:MAG: hypothetical protein R2747_22790 [Pyrinomonadaceae bacterium]